MASCNRGDGARWRCSVVAAGWDSTGRAEMEVGVPVAVAVSPEMGPVSEQSMVMLRKAVWEKGVDGLAPVQLAPTKAIHIDEIISTHKGES